MEKSTEMLEKAWVGGAGLLKGQRREAGGVSEPKTLMAVLFPFKLSRQQRPFQPQAWAGLRVPASGRTHSPSYPQESGDSLSFRCGPRMFTSLEENLAPGSHRHRLQRAGFDPAPGRRSAQVL